VEQNEEYFILFLICSSLTLFFIYETYQTPAHEAMGNSA